MLFISAVYRNIYYFNKRLYKCVITILSCQRELTVLLYFLVLLKGKLYGQYNTRNEDHSEC